MTKRSSATSTGETVHVARLIRRSNRRRLVFAAVLLVVLASWASADARDIANVVHGAEIVNGEEFAVDVGAQRAVGRWISITGDTTVASRLTEERRDTLTGSPHRTPSFALMRIGHQLLIVRAGSRSIDATQKGIVAEIPADIEDRVATPLRAQGLQVLPVVLDAARPYRSDVLGRLASLVLFGLVSLVLLFTGLVRALDHSRHPIVRSLSTLGDPQQTAFVVEDELAQPQTVVGPLRFTRQFVVRLTRSDLAVARLDDVVFAYARSRPWIPVLSLLVAVVRPDRASVVVYDRDGWQTRLRTRDGRSARVALDELSRRCPWAVVGREYRPLWKRQRQRFLAAVEQRRRAPVLDLPPDADVASPARMLPRPVPVG